MATFRPVEGPVFFRYSAGSALFDAKGRELGFAGWVVSLTWELAPDDSGWHADHRSLAFRYRARVQATRADELFGALKPAQSFRTLEEAEAWVRETIAERLRKLKAKRAKGGSS